MHINRQRKIERQEKIRALYEKGYSRAHISAEMNVSLTVVSEALRFAEEHG